jgi:hypothetical protein
LVGGLRLPVDQADLSKYFQGYTLVLEHGRLYCYPRRWGSPHDIHKKLPLFAIDLKDPDHPRIAQTLEGPWPDFYRDGWGDRDYIGKYTAFTLRFPAAPGLSDREKLDLCIRGSSEFSPEGDLLVTAFTSLPEIWRLTELTETRAGFKLIGSAEYSPFERLTMSYFGDGGSPQLLVHDQRVYIVREDINMGVTVYDIHDPTYPVEVGHFAAPDDTISGLAPLPDGRVLVTGSRLYVLDPPRSAG